MNEMNGVVSNCGIPGFGIIQKIPYLPSQSTCGPIDVQFSSACVRCGLCIAIAEQMNQTLIETHDLMSPEEWLDEGEASALLRSVCDYSFKHYSLREIDGKNYICDRMPGANLVPSTADGLWEKK
ncbi:uncharacterized protein LOC105697489 [Orussus abietinus]|uniref:uncharacterized protein LOC105697489 n=1 Tax=Orussus abietinus TaxID=222816 RepID=UPI000C71604D|nr:uncharacterized protein LOC105697489 [Orussus abietinus]